VRRIAIVMASVAALLVADARAAEAPAPKPEPKSASKAAPPAGAPTPPAAPAEPPAPYEPQLLRLAEMMGALAYLRDLCGADDGAEFRSKMKSLLDADGVGESQRDLLAGAYNRGFEGYRLTYRTCTPAAGVIIARYLAETARLASELAGRYGG
jgi:uncharacterized protein (TIGR02301 family)